MDDFLIIFNNEAKSLAKGTKSTVFLLFLVSMFWGFFLSYNIFDAQKSIIWIIAAAFVASCGFSNVSFARERLCGSWEIILASGISRKTIFLAKFLFTQASTLLCGIITLIISHITALFLFGLLPIYDFFIEISLFFCAALCINSINAYFTIINLNMRAVQLINIFVISLCITVITYVSNINISPNLTLNESENLIAVLSMAIILIPSVIFLILCQKTLYDDKIILPIIY